MTGTLAAGKQQRGSVWIWACYLIFFLIDPILKPSLWMWVGTLSFTVIFLAAYRVHVYTKSERARRWVILIIFVLALTSMPWNSGASTFFIFTAALLPFAFTSTRTVLILLATESAVCIGEAYLLHHEWPYQAWLGSLVAVALIGVIGGGNIFFAQQRRADCKLRMAQEEIEALAAVAERERIARDLHDVLGHTLSVIAMKAELAGRLLAQTENRAAIERARTEIADVESMGRTALTEVRDAIGGYRARGLSAELDHARRTLQAAGVEIRINETRSLRALSAAEETALSLALREAVTNIVRHSQATECRLRLAEVSGRTQLIVEDNGRHSAIGEGNGLRGMRERVEALGGHVELQRERGTRLTVELPLRAGGTA